MVSRNKHILGLFSFFFIFHLVPAQEKIKSKDLINLLYNHHMISLEMKNNEKKGRLYVDYVRDNNYEYEIAFLDRNPVRIIDSEDILKISISDTNNTEKVLQNSFDKGINDIQDFDKKIITEFSKVILTKEATALKPIYSFDMLRQKVFDLQKAKQSKKDLDGERLK